MSRPRIAVVGCGAIARSFHVPALAKRPGIAENLILVDRSMAHAQNLAAEFGVRVVRDDHRSVLGEVQGAIIAVPPQHHASIAMDFLNSGIPVLCEKPLAMCADEARLLVRAFEHAGVPLAVNNQRRLLPSLQTAKELITSGTVGILKEIEIYDGAPFGWPLASGTLFGRSGGGRGILQDIGAHVLDTLCWWLGGTPQVTRYRDDSFGGTEAVARVEFEYEDCRGVVQLSWLSHLRNEFLIKGERLQVAGQITAWDHVNLMDPERAGRQKLKLKSKLPHSVALRDHMIENFLDVVSGKADPLVPASHVIPSLEMIDACYEGRKRFIMPWMGVEGVEYAFE